MKKGIRNIVEAGALSLATLLGSCGVDNDRALNPRLDLHKDKYNVSYSKNAEGFEARRSRFSANNPALEAKVNDSIENIADRGRGSAKPAASVENFEYDAFTGDLDLDHDVDFDDFFLLADNFGNPYDFDHFFKLADSFGKTVNRSPLVQNLVSSNGDKADVGEEITFTAIVTDPENDAINHEWAVNGTNLGSNGKELVWEGNAAGNYEISVKAIDNPYNAESNSMARKVTVEDAAPVLNFPEEVIIQQWTEGERDGGIARINWKNYAEDKKFSDEQLSLTPTPTVLNNNFSHYDEFGNLLYDSEALDVIVNGDHLVINPKKNFNSTDYGTRDLQITVRNPDGRESEKTVRVNVQRQGKFDTLYDDVVTERCWCNGPLTNIYIYNRVREEGNSWNPREWTGRRLTDEEKMKFEVVTGDFVRSVDNYFGEINFHVIDETSEFEYDGSFKILDIPEFSAIFYLDENIDLGGTVLKNNYGDIAINPRTFAIDASRDFDSVFRHELTHLVIGTKHPDRGKYSVDELYKNLFDGASRLTYTPPLHEAIMRTRYEL